MMPKITGGSPAATTGRCRAAIGDTFVGIAPRLVHSCSPVVRVLSEEQTFMGEAVLSVAPRAGLSWRTSPARSFEQTGYQNAIPCISARARNAARISLVHG